MCARSTCKLRSLRIHLDLVVVLKPGTIPATTREALVTCLVELEEAEEESRAASPLEPNLLKTALERRQRKDLEKLPVDVAARSESLMTFCLLINAFANKLSLLTYCLNNSKF